MSTESTTTDRWWLQSSERRGQIARLLLIGLDGATFDILNPMMDQGRMPRLKRLMEKASSGVLMSTVPPITPAAWSTFMTGKGPGRHGILDFERYDATTNRLSFNSSYEVKQRTIWEILSAAGLRVGSIQVPMTYPPRAVNGFVITGFETPGTDAQFTYPAELKNEILDRWPDFNFRTKWKRSTFGGLKLFEENIDYINRSFDQGVFLAQYCGEKYHWDVMMVLYKLVDNLQHKTWKYLDPATKHCDPQRAALAAGCFEHLDRCLGQLFDYADSRAAAVMIMSDHGHGSLDGKVQPNMQLRDWGYLAINRAAQTSARTSHLLSRWFKKKKSKFADDAIEQDLAIDWTETRAFVAHAGMCGFLYLNLAGRQPTGIVQPDDYESVREEIACRFTKLTCCTPDGQTIRPIEAVHKPEQLYNCARSEYPWMPDLLLVPRPGLAVVRKIRGNQAVHWIPFRKREGTHRMEGVFVASGRGIRLEENVDATLADLAPTILAGLGLPVPEDMEGNVLNSIFSIDPQVQYVTPLAPTSTSDQQEVYSEQEQAILTERLADLGYLE